MKANFMSLLFCSDGVKVVRGFFFSNRSPMYLVQYQQQINNSGITALFLKTYFFQICF